MNRTKLLITGGSGMLGQNIIQDLKKNYEISVLDMKDPKDPDVRFIRGDLRDLGILRKSTGDIEAVIHLAAFSMEKSIPTYADGWEVNCTGTFNVFEAAVQNRVKKVVFASSICVNGPITWASERHSIDYFPIDEEHSTEPQDLYGTSKLIGEKLARMYAEKSPTRFICLRMATIWAKSPVEVSPGTKWIIDSFAKDPQAVLAIPQTEARRFAMRDLAWQYVDVRDVVQAFRLALVKEDIRYAVYNIGAADTPSNWESLRLAQFLYPEVTIRNPFSFFVEKKRALWDISKAQKELGYRPQYTWGQHFLGQE